MRIYQQALSKIMKTYNKDFSKALLHTGAIAYVSSSLAQIGAIALNERTDAETKKYLMLQETGECLMNTALFYTVCQFVKTKTEKLLKEGAIMPKSAKGVIPKGKVEDVQVLLTSLLEKTDNSKEIIKIRKDLKFLTPFVKNAFALISAIVASNIITPIFRNYFAQYFSKK